MALTKAKLIADNAVKAVHIDETDTGITLAQLNVTGDITATNVAGTLSTAAQPNITSVGTLSSLAINGGLLINGSSNISTLLTDSDNSLIALVASSALVDNKPRIQIIGTTFASSPNTIEYLANTHIFKGSNASLGEKVRIDSSGNLLVGLTSGGKFSVSYGSGNDTHFGLGANYDNYITAGSSGTTIFRNATTERVRIDSAGNVGIGTTNPTHFLHISRLATFASIMLENQASNAYCLYQGKTANSSTWQWGVWNDNSYRVGISGVADYMAITSGGKVLIGTTSGSVAASGLQSSSLHVNDEIMSMGSYAGLFFENRSGGVTSSDNWYGWYNTGDTTYFYAAPSNVASINSSNGTYTALSDRNKKKDFEDSNIGLNEILQLKPTLYRMLDEDDSYQKSLGFIAQDVKEVIPQAYVESGDLESKFIGLSDRPILAAAIKAIQELKSLIDNQQIEIENLKAQLNG